MHPPIDYESSEEALDRAVQLLRPAKAVAVLTGAGISAESGLATFRGAGGLWEGHRVEDVATPRAFLRDPELVWRFYNLRRANLAAVKPNPGHLALVELENRLGAGFTLVTQNVDGLHQAAGNKNVLEIHGTLRRVRCVCCERVTDHGVEPLADLPHCAACGALLRPDVVWFEEPLPTDIWDRSVSAAASCDCFLVVGTSAVVYPAAGLIDVARMDGADVIEANLDRSAASSRVDVLLLGPSGTTLPELIKRLH
ncbi:MAG: NAD-dependent deacylase [Planctomycetes bacterium]|nr:NAD-dependent deacylase [Planctomycetota bacterium]